MITPEESEILALLNGRAERLKRAGMSAYAVKLNTLTMISRIHERVGMDYPAL